SADRRGGSPCGATERSSCHSRRIRAAVLFSGPRRRFSSDLRLRSTAFAATPGKSPSHNRTARSRMRAPQEDGMARAIRIEKTGGPEVMKLAEVEVPKPDKGQALVRV